MYGAGIKYAFQRSIVLGLRIVQLFINRNLKIESVGICKKMASAPYYMHQPEILMNFSLLISILRNQQHSLKRNGTFCVINTSLISIILRSICQLHATYLD